MNNFMFSMETIFLDFDVWVSINFSKAVCQKQNLISDAVQPCLKICIYLPSHEKIV